MRLDADDDAEEEHVPSNNGTKASASTQAQDERHQSPGIGEDG